MILATPKYIEILAKRLLNFPFLRLVLISILNFLFISKVFKNYFEKVIFNPYFIPSIKEIEIRLQAESLLKEIGDVKGKTLLELGPGGDCLLACHLLNAGAKKVILLDIENHIHIPPTEVNKYRSVYPEALDDKGALMSDKIDIISYDKNGLVPLPNDSIDSVYSFAVFEHIPNPSWVIDEIQRIMKPTGKSFHQIDFRDHIFQQSSLFFLLFSNRVFNFLFSRTGMWTNRIRYSQWRKLFTNSKFIILQEKTTTMEFNKLSSKHLKKLRFLSHEDIITTGASFLLTK